MENIRKELKEPLGDVGLVWDYCRSDARWKGIWREEVHDVIRVLGVVGIRRHGKAGDCGVGHLGYGVVSACACRSVRCKEAKQ